jgi:hypothetical protein
VGISKFTERPLNFLNIPNQSLDISPLLLPLNPLCSSASRLCRRRRTSHLATALPSTPLTTSCFSFPRVTPLLPAALAEPYCLASRAPRSSRALAGRHLAARCPRRSRDHPFLSSFPSLLQTKRYYKPDQTPPLPPAALLFLPPRDTEPPLLFLTGILPNRATPPKFT